MLNAPAEMSDPNAAEIDGPKKKIVVRFVISSLVYHLDSVYRPPGINPLSARPRNRRAAYQLLALRTNI